MRDLTAEGPGGPIPLRVYRPAGVPSGTALPVLVFFHGGGWVIGDLDTHDVLCRQITAEAGITVVAVDYRLAPEHKFPAAVDDAWAATRWVAAHAASSAPTPAGGPLPETARAVTSRRSSRSWRATAAGRPSRCRCSSIP